MLTPCKCSVLCYTQCGSVEIKPNPYLVTISPIYYVLLSVYILSIRILLTPLFYLFSILSRICFYYCRYIRRSFTLHNNPNTDPSNPSTHFSRVELVGQVNKTLKTCSATLKQLLHVTLCQRSCSYIY